jgi:hypothetical protein
MRSNPENLTAGSGFRFSRILEKQHKSKICCFSGPTELSRQICALIPKILPLEAILDFRGSSKNNTNRRFAVFRDQLSYLAVSALAFFDRRSFSVVGSEGGPFDLRSFSEGGFIFLSTSFCGCKYNQFVTNLQ